MRIVHNPVQLLKSDGKNVRFFKHRDTIVKRDDHCAGSVSVDAVCCICSRDTGFFLIKKMADLILICSIGTRQEGGFLLPRARSMKAFKWMTRDEK